jgi:hypothetical protein
MNICWRQWAFWTTVDKHNTGKHSKSLRGYPCRSCRSMAGFPMRFWSGWVRAFGANTQTSERTTIGFSTVMMHPLTHHLFHNSCLPRTLQWFPPSPYSPDVTLCDFFLFPPRWHYSWMDIVLTWLRRSMQNRKRLSAHSHLSTFRDAWNHGKHAGITVYMPKGTTLMETVGTRRYSYKLFVGSNSPKFCVALHTYD